MIDWPFRWRLAQARIEVVRQLGGRPRSAGCGRAALSPNPSNLRPVAALKARVYLRQGNLPAATAWVAACGVTATDALSYQREFEHIILARVLLAKLTRSVTARYHREHVASDLPGNWISPRLLAAAKAGGGIGSQIEILLLQEPRPRRWATEGGHASAATCAGSSRAGGPRPAVRRRGRTTGTAAGTERMRAVGCSRTFSAYRQPSRR